MAYSKLLLQIMKDKNLTATEIIERCKSEDVDIKKEYFSKIKNNVKNPPSEKVSRAIAKACGIDERLLVIEGYIDKAPKEIKNIFTAINFMVNIATAKLINLIQRKDIKKLKAYIEDYPVSNTLIEILDSQETYIKFLENNYIFENLNDDLALSLLLKEPPGFDIKDDAMSPILQKGDKVRIELTTHFGNSDILLVKPKNNKNVIARYVHKVNNTFVLVPLQKPYKEIICNKNELNILGKVSYIIRKV